MKPYSVWIKWDTDEWYKVFETDCAPCASDYAKHNVAKGGWHIKRIEVRDLTGPLQTTWDRSWP
jgi:methylase of polypeptide subunit release factors